MRELIVSTFDSSVHIRKLLRDGYMLLVCSLHGHHDAFEVKLQNIKFARTDPFAFRDVELCSRGPLYLLLQARLDFLSFRGTTLRDGCNATVIDRWILYPQVLVVRRDRAFHPHM